MINNLKNKISKIRVIILRFYAVLPARFFYSGNFTFTREFTETNPAHIEVAHISPLPSATKTTADDAR